MINVVQIDLFADPPPPRRRVRTGPERRDAGIASVLQTQGETWTDHVQRFATAWIRGAGRFKGEDLRAAYLAAGGIDSTHPNAWGAVIRWMSCRGLTCPRS